MVKVQNELPVSRFPLPLLFQVVLPIRWELRDLPYLPFVLAQILDNEWFYIRNAQQALAGCMNCKPAQVASDPPAIEFFCGYGSGARTNKSVENDVTFI